MNPRSTDMLRAVIAEKLDCPVECFPVEDLAQRVFLYEDHPRPGESWSDQLDRLDVLSMAKRIVLPKLSRKQEEVLRELCRPDCGYASHWRGDLNLFVKEVLHLAGTLLHNKHIRCSVATIRALERAGMIRSDLRGGSRSWIEPSFFGRLYMRRTEGVTQ